MSENLGQKKKNKRKRYKLTRGWNLSRDQPHKHNERGGGMTMYESDTQRQEWVGAGRHCWRLRVSVHQQASIKKRLFFPPSQLRILASLSNNQDAAEMLRLWGCRVHHSPN